MLSRHAIPGAIGTHHRPPCHLAMCHPSRASPVCLRTAPIQARGRVRAGPEGKGSLEQVLLEELIASRRQVDRLLDQQNLLLSLVAQEATPVQPDKQGIPESPGHAPPNPASSTPPLEQAQERSSRAGTRGRGASPVPPSGFTSSGNPVADVLRQSGALAQEDDRTIDDSVSTQIQAAFSAVGETDVLADLDPMLMPSSKAGASASRPQPPPSASRTSGSAAAASPSAAAAAPNSASSPTGGRLSGMQMVPQPELAPSGASLTGEAGELVPLPQLQRGDTSAFWIDILQVALMSHGIMIPDEGFTFGPSAEAAVKRYQAANELPQTGTTDAATWGRMLSNLPQLRQDTIRKVACGAAAAIVEWGRANMGTSLAGSPPARSPASSPANSGSPLSGSPSAGSPASSPASSQDGDEGVTFRHSGSDVASGGSVIDSIRSSSISGGGAGSSRGSPGATMESVTASGGVDSSGGSRSSPGAAASAGMSSSSGSSGVVSGGSKAGSPAGVPGVRNSPGAANVGSGNAGGIPITDGPVGVNFFSDIIEMAAEEKQEAEEEARKQKRVQDEREGSSSSSSSSSSSESDSGDEGGAGGGTAVAGGVPSGSATLELPELSLGNDDIEWMSVLHRALQSSGYYPSDDEVENWVFGEGTQEALLTFQACNRLPETGVVGQPTWDVLLSSDEALRSEAYARAAKSGNAGSSSDGSGSNSSTQGPGARGSMSQDDEGWMTDEEAVRALNASTGRWPILVENEGGKEVQLMQLALSSQGFNCGEDEMQYWMFGEMTSNALRTFQACAGLKETGVCDERTWKKLLRNDRVSPEDLPWLRERLLTELKAKGLLDEDYAADITEGDQVFLLGEQRWEKR